MLALITAQMLLMSGGCHERCAAEINKCQSGCGASAQCAHHCDGRAADCNAGCDKTKDKAEAAARAKEPAIPCGAKRGNNGAPDKLQPCSESEMNTYKDALNSPEAKKYLKCKDAEGNPTPCKEDAAKVKEITKGISQSDMCTDSDGKTTVCEGAQKRVKANIQKQK